jgi:hypothetical protein
VAAPISHFVSLEVGDLVHRLPGFRPVATGGPRAVVTVIRMEAVIYVAVEPLRAMKPWASANEDAA